MSQTILERAADVRQMKAQLEAECAELRHVGGQWTDHALAAEDAMKIADDGLRNCWLMLDRIRQLARAELKRLEAEKEAE